MLLQLLHDGGAFMGVCCNRTYISAVVRLWVYIATELEGIYISVGLIADVHCNRSHSDVQAYSDVYRDRALYGCTLQ